MLVAPGASLPSCSACQRLRMRSLRAAMRWSLTAQGQQESAHHNAWHREIFPNCSPAHRAPCVLSSSSIVRTVRLCSWGFGLRWCQGGTRVRLTNSTARRVLRFRNTHSLKY